MFVSKIINNSNSYLIHTSSNYIVKPTVLIDSWTSYSDPLFVAVELNILNDYNLDWGLPPLSCIYNEFNILNADEILNTINLISNCDSYIHNNSYRFVVSLLNLCLFNKCLLIFLWT